MNQDALRIGLVGTGGVCAGVHYPGLRLIPGVEISGICEPDETLRQKRQAEWGIADAFDRLDALLEAVVPDAVCIAVPNVYHYELIVQALDAGCHVLCEKPLGMDFAQTQEIYARGKASGCRHMTAFT
ncbi:MAG: Gfo/Idh/MocA family oxidoreductase [Gemmatimonadetes bacterium]|nr:Gfo/Idh/MocA family oxidoreductase [Gemmatimonadota bacterium]